MKKLLIALSVLAMTTACNSQKNPFLEEWNTPYGTAPFSQIKTEHYLPAFQAGIAEKRAGVLRGIPRCSVGAPLPRPRLFGRL